MNLSEDTWLVSPNRQLGASTPTPWLARLQASLGHMFTTWRAHRQRTRDVAALQMFNDRELWDLGLSRTDIMGISNGTYHRD